MKKLITFLIALILLFPSVSFSKSIRVRGYYKKSGEYVAPHHRTSPNKSRSDNWSTKRNVNPYTGKKGTVDPYKPKGHNIY